MAPVFKSLVADGSKVIYEWKKSEKEAKPAGASNFILFLNKKKKKNHLKNSRF